jgi:two-component system, OmpR family, alkaline phosphatase synthesis response regulator PhoP
MSRVLLIEADYPLAQTAKQYLRSQGHSVRWQPDPQSAVNSADKWHPDIIVLDLVLGSHNGVEFLYEFRSYPEWLTVPIIIYSSLSPQAMVGSEAALSDLTISAYLYKPDANLAVLSNAIAKHSATVTA